MNGLVYLDFRKALNANSHEIFTANLMKLGQMCRQWGGLKSGWMYGPRAWWWEAWSLVGGQQWCIPEVNTLSSLIQNLNSWAGWWSRVHLQQVFKWHQTGRSGWYGRVMLTSKSPSWKNCWNSSGKFVKFNERQNKVLHLRRNKTIHHLILRTTL